jgi:glucokinase
MGNQKSFIGVDLGGTHLRAGIVDSETGKISGFKQIPTQAYEGHDAIIVRMAELIEEVIASEGDDRTKIGGVGIGVPGIIDMERGWVKFLPNLPDNWRDVPLCQAMEERVGLTTHLLNDARSATFGEWKFGGGRGVQTMACFTLGTGIGGGTIINGRLHLGIGGTAGELGHLTIDFNGPRCGCGNYGCLEAFASGPAIAAMGIKAVIQGLTTNIGALVDHDLNRITSKVIYQAALEGDAVACEIFELAGYYIGIAVTNVLVNVGPRKVVIGGGVSQAGNLLLDPIRRKVNERSSVIPVSEVQIVLAELGTNAGLIGAALWAKEQIEEQKR